MPITFEQHTLANGLTVIAEIDPDAHSAAAGFFVKTGARDETSDLMGVSHFLEHMMFKGTESISAEDLNRKFDDLGARNNAYTSSELTCFYAHVLPERLRDATDLLARMMRPALRKEDFETEKGVILEEIAMYQDDPFWVLYEEAVERHYNDHALGHRVLGTDETINEMQSDAMRGYFTDRYSSDNTVLAVAGRADIDQILLTAERTCGSWTPTQVSRDSTRPQTGAGEFTKTDENVNRGYLLGLSSGPGMEDERRYAMSLLAQILGAADNSLFHWALIEPGIAEFAQAGFQAHDGTGDMYVFAAADPNRLDEVWGIMRSQIERAAESATEQDLERLRNKMATAATLGGERPGDRMQRLGRLWTYRNEYIPLEQELEQICAVKLDDIAAVVRDFPIMPATLGRLVPA